jgi:flagellar protein FlaI
MKTGEVTLFDLVRTSLRYRPDYIVVGEIRGGEAFVLFQALATGHGGMTTLHAENLDYAVKRLTSPPMNVAKTYVPLINVAAIQERVQLPNPTGDVTFGRRLKSVVELTYDGDYRTIATWDPIRDRYQIDLKNSLHLEKIALNHGVATGAVLKEVQNRVRLLKSLQRKGIAKNVDVAKFITNYYLEAPALRMNAKTKKRGKGT